MCGQSHTTVEEPPGTREHSNVVAAAAAARFASAEVLMRQGSGNEQPTLPVQHQAAPHTISGVQLTNAVGVREDNSSTARFLTRGPCSRLPSRGSNAVSDPDPCVTAAVDQLDPMAEAFERQVANCFAEMERHTWPKRV